MRYFLIRTTISIVKKLIKHFYFNNILHEVFPEFFIAINELRNYFFFVFEPVTDIILIIIPKI